MKASKKRIGKGVYGTPPHVIRRFFLMSVTGKSFSPEPKDPLIWMKKNPGLFGVACGTAGGKFPCDPAENPAKITCIPRFLRMVMELAARVEV
jgi:hypothetical protein